MLLFSLIFLYVLFQMCITNNGIPLTLYKNIRLNNGILYLTLETIITQMIIKIVFLSKWK